MATKTDLSRYFASIGKRGGKARVENLTPEERTEAARKAGKASGAARKAKAAGKKRNQKATA